MTIHQIILAYESACRAEQRALEDLHRALDALDKSREDFADVLQSLDGGMLVSCDRAYWLSKKGHIRQAPITWAHDLAEAEQAQQPEQQQPEQGDIDPWQQAYALDALDAEQPQAAEQEC